MWKPRGTKTRPTSPSFWQETQCVVDGGVALALHYRRWAIWPWNRIDATHSRGWNQSLVAGGGTCDLPAVSHSVSHSLGLLVYVQKSSPLPIPFPSPTPLSSSLSVIVSSLSSSSPFLPHPSLSDSLSPISSVRKQEKILNLVIGHRVDIPLYAWPCIPYTGTSGL